MQMNERSEAIRRAQRALKALGEHPRSSKKELGHAREHVNACYSHGSGEYVWNAVAQVEAMADRRYGVPSTDEQRQLVEATEDLEEPATSRPRPSGRGPRNPVDVVDPCRDAGKIDEHSAGNFDERVVIGPDCQDRGTRVESRALMEVEQQSGRRVGHELVELVEAGEERDAAEIVGNGK